MTLLQIEVKDRNSDDYLSYWEVSRHDGRLYTRPLESESWGAAEAEAHRTATEGYEPLAIVRFTHPPYADPAGARQHAVDLILEAVAGQLGLPPATEG